MAWGLINLSGETGLAQSDPIYLPTPAIAYQSPVQFERGLRRVCESVGNPQIIYERPLKARASNILRLRGLSPCDYGFGAMPIPAGHVRSPRSDHPNGQA